MCHNSTSGTASHLRWWQRWGPRKKTEMVKLEGKLTLLHVKCKSPATVRHEVHLKWAIQLQFKGLVVVAAETGLSGRVSPFLDFCSHRSLNNKYSPFSPEYWKITVCRSIVLFQRSGKSKGRGWVMRICPATSLWLWKRIDLWISIWRGRVKYWLNIEIRVPDNNTIDCVWLCQQEKKYTSYMASYRVFLAECSLHNATRSDLSMPVKIFFEEVPHTGTHRGQSRQER